jgi:hypothetical protein
MINLTTGWRAREAVRSQKRMPRCRTPLDLALAVALDTVRASIRVLRRLPRRTLCILVDLSCIRGDVAAAARAEGFSLADEGAARRWVISEIECSGRCSPLLDHLRSAGAVCLPLR